MGLAIDLAYLAAAPVAIPALAVKSLRTGKYRTDMAGRFGFGGDLPRREAGEKVLLLHCVSVGELNSVQTLVQRLLAADERLSIAITTTTDTGTERARRVYGNMPRVCTARFPFDLSFAVENLLDRVRPDLAVLVELETWPNFLAIARSRRVPVALINGRISDRSFPRYRAIRPIMASMLRQIDWIGAQTETIAGRFRALGAEAARVEVLPTLKYDNAVVGDRVAGQEALEEAMGLLTGQRMVVGGSIGPDEEIPLLNWYMNTVQKDPFVRLAIAPRHPEAVPKMLRSIERFGLTPILRSEFPDLNHEDPSVPYFSETLRSWEPSEVFVLNTMGELRKLYALAFGVFVGRSLFKKSGGGSDMIEVAALGKPCCFGPFTANFAEVVELLVGNGGAVSVMDGAGVAPLLDGWLSDPEAARAMGGRAQELIRRQQEAQSTERYVRKLLAMLR